MDSELRDVLDELWGMMIAQQVRIAELEHQNERQNQQLQALQPSDTERSASTIEDGPRRLSRAGMLKAATAGAAATVGAGALMQARSPLAAASDGATVTTGATVTAESATSIIFDGTTSPGVILLVEDGSTFPASNAGFRAAIGGWAAGPNVAHGIYGFSETATGMGVVGWGVSSHGVYGLTDGAGKAGVYGNGRESGSYGVFGTSNGNSASYAGVFDGNVSVTGGSTTVHNPSGHAILGTSDATNYGGLSGATTVSGGAGLIGTNSNVAGAYGGLIYGPLVVTGTKSAAVMHPDGTRRLVYCVEAPESYLEDVGEAHLVNGRAEVRLRPDFVPLIDTSDYYVFLTERDLETRGLVVTELHSDRFVVQEKAGGRSKARFQYRIMAKRGDVTAERLARFDVPEPDIAAAMHHPEIPEAPAVSNHGRP